MKQTRLQRISALLLSAVLLPGVSGTTPKSTAPVVSQPHFLGEHVRLYSEDGAVEKQLIKGIDNAALLCENEKFRLCWRTESGAEIGTGEQLERLTPAQSKTYRLCIETEDSSGHAISVREGVYHVNIVSGTIVIKVHAEKKQVTDEDKLHFIARRSTGERFTCTAARETDPETGQVFLAGQLTGLPYGVYTVTPVMTERTLYAEPTQQCSLGVWEQDDTVSVRRAHAQVVFTLK